MADDIRIEITGDSKDIKKVIETANKLLTRFEKTAKKSTERRINNEKKASQKHTAIEERKNERIAAMDKRLSRKRARNRLRGMKERIRIAKREAANEERIKQRSVARMRKIGKMAVAGIGLAGVGVGVAGGVAILKGIAKQELALRRLALNAKLTKKEELELANAIDKVAISTGADRGIMTDAISQIQKGSGVVLSAEKDVLKIGKLLRILGEEEAVGIADTIAAMQLNFKDLGLDFMELMEKSIVVGNAGNFTLSNLASRGRQLTVVFKNLGGETAKDWGHFNALVQIFSAVNGSVEKTTTAVENFSLAMTSTKKQTAFRKAGVNIFQADGKTLKKGHELIKTWIDFIKKGGNIEQFGFDKTILASFKSMVGQGEKLNELLSISEDTAGELDRQFEGVQDTMDATLSIMGQLGQVLSQKVMKKLFKDLSTNMNKFLDDEEKMNKLVESAEALGTALSGIVPVLSWIHKTMKVLAIPFAGWAMLIDYIGQGGTRKTMAENEAAVKKMQEQAASYKASHKANVANKNLQIEQAGLLPDFAPSHPSNQPPINLSIDNKTFVEPTTGETNTNTTVKMNNNNVGESSSKQKAGGSSYAIWKELNG